MMSGPLRALIPIGLGTTLSLMGDAALYTVLPTHTAAAGVTLASVGILLSANRWIRLLLNSLAGAAYGRWPRRWLFVPALFVGAISTAMYAFTDGFWPLLAGRLLWGIAWSGIWVGGNTIILDVTTDEDRGRWTGLYQLTFYLGTTIGAFSGGILTDWLGYHRALGIAAGGTAVGAMVALFFLPETKPDAIVLVGANLSASISDLTPPSPLPEAGRGEPNSYSPPDMQRAGRESDEDRQRETLVPATALYAVNRFVVAGVMTATVGLLIQQRWGDAILAEGISIGVATLTGTLLSLSTLISMVAAPVAGHWSDRADTRWRVAAAGLIPGLLGFGFLAAGLPSLILFGVPLTAITSGSNQSLATALLGDATQGAQRGGALGWMHTFGDLSSAIAPPLAYALIPLVGLTGVYVMCVVVLAAMLIWAVRLAWK